MASKVNKKRKVNGYSTDLVDPSTYPVDVGDNLNPNSSNPNDEIPITELFKSKKNVDIDILFPASKEIKKSIGISKEISKDTQSSNVYIPPSQVPNGQDNNVELSICVSRYVLPRKNHMKHVNTGIIFTPYEELFFKNVIFDVHNQDRFMELGNGKPKEQFIFNLVHKYHLLDENVCVVLKYNEDMKKYLVLQPPDIIEYMKFKFKHFKHGFKKKSDKNELPVYKSINECLENGQLKVENVYTKNELRCKEEEDVNEWPNYSMWHSLYEDVSIMMYSGSNRLNNSSIIHKCTRLKLLFPKEKTFMLVFHGRTVHCGSRSKLVNESFHYSHDVRLFSYVDKYNPHLEREDCSATNSIKNNLRSRGQKKYPQTTTATVETNSVKMCSCIANKYNNNNVPMTCAKCDDTIRKIKGWNCFEEALVVDVMTEYKLSKKSSAFRHEPNLVCGNLELWGWAVYEGINIHTIEYLPLKTEVMNIVHEERKWKGLQYLTGKQNRKYFDIGGLVDNKTSQNTNLLRQLFSSIQKKIKTIDDFKNGGLASTILLSNFGMVDEQPEHRDYKG